MKETENIEKNNIPENWGKNITLFLISQAVSLLGSSIVQYAIIWYITLVSKSGWMVTVATLYAFLPQIVVSIFAGVWADRYNKKKLIMIADSAIAASTLAVAIAFLLGIDKMWLLFIVLAIRSLRSWSSRTSSKCINSKSCTRR